MRAMFQSLLCLMAAASIGCANDPATSQKELSGTVRDRLNNRAISRATVTFTSDTRYTESTRTDGDGHYEMVVETDTDLGQVSAAHPDYRPAEATVFFDAPQRTVNLTLLPN